MQYFFGQPGAGNDDVITVTKHDDLRIDLELAAAFIIWFCGFVGPRTDMRKGPGEVMRKYMPSDYYLPLIALFKQAEKIYSFLSENTAMTPVLGKWDGEDVRLITDSMKVFEEWLGATLEYSEGEAYAFITKQKVWTNYNSRFLHLFGLTES